MSRPPQQQQHRKDRISPYPQKITQEIDMADEESENEDQDIRLLTEAFGQENTSSTTSSSPKSPEEKIHQDNVEKEESNEDNGENKNNEDIQDSGDEGKDLALVPTFLLLLAQLGMIIL